MPATTTTYRLDSRINGMIEELAAIYGSKTQVVSAAVYLFAALPHDMQVKAVGRYHAFKDEGRVQEQPQPEPASNPPENRGVEDQEAPSGDDPAPAGLSW